MIPLQIIRCPKCKNTLDIETIYSGICIVCEFVLRSKNKQNYEFDLEVCNENY